MEGDDERKIGNKRGRDDEAGRGLEKRASGVIEEYSNSNGYSYSGDEMINGVKYEEEKETAAAAADPAGGLFNQLITSLVNSPTSKSDQQEAAAAAGGEEEDKLMNSSGEDVVQKNQKDGNGNIIDNIVARLPRTLSEDTAPATDEASILIHSIIHD